MKRNSRGQALTGEMILAAITIAVVYFLAVQLVHGVKWIGHEVGSAVHHVLHRAVKHPLGIERKDEKK